ncbi:MAG: DUF222 domain-containing protein [Micrococcus sp.]|nr:DUF222 domain-containing protein [Micrococcus sp.]
MTAQEREQPFDSPADELDQIPLEELVKLTYAASRALTRRLSSARSLDELDPVLQQNGNATDWGSLLSVSDEADPGTAADHPQSFKPFIVPASSGRDDAATSAPSPPVATGDVPFTLPALHHALETVARSVTAAQMSLAGHTAEVFDLPTDRTRLLGMPEGKTAFRDTADYLRGMLRVDISEARRRLRHAAVLRGSRAITGEVLPPRLPQLAEAVQEGLIDRSAVEHVNNTLAEARTIAERAGIDPDIADRMIRQGEELMVEQGQTMDPRNLQKVCHHWLKRFEAAVDPDGKEPVDLDSPRVQGLMHKGKRNGFHQWLLSANDAQHEILLTIANAATNPRARQNGPVPGQAELAPEPTDGDAEPPIDPRTDHQKRLDGLIACLSGGLAMADSNTLPWTGGMRPQVSVTIDYRTLLGDLVDTGTITADDLARFQSTAAFTGTVHPQNIRTLACDADILPVVLSGDGQVLDVGRAQRLFPARLRQAIAARDGGCAAPGCGIPAPWCDVHHVEHWERGGPTSTDNGVLLCNHHHHAVHAGAWKIDMRSGRPWFIPAPYLDPSQRPQRNRYWRQ